jgi:hypothetical protein
MPSTPDWPGWRSWSTRTGCARTPPSASGRSTTSGGTGFLRAWRTPTIEERSLAYQRLRRELLDAERGAVHALRNEGKISEDVMNRVQRDLDLEDSRLDV